MAHTTINEATSGLSKQHLDIITQILRQSPHVEEAVLFGSRAKGNYKTASDIDLAIKGHSIHKDDIAFLWDAFEESLLPYFVDVIAYASVTNTNLKDHIDRVGLTIYKRIDLID